MTKVEATAFNGQEAEVCDALVLGGGPGGSAAAIFLAKAGLKVVLVEKDRHPRFHIGESLLPHSLTILERLGVLDEVKAIGTYKPAAEFIAEDGDKTVVFNFDRALFDGPGHAYQVERAKFDHLLFKRAAAVGARAMEETTATVLACSDDEALIATDSASGEQRLFRAGILIDSSGRSTTMAKLRGEKHPDPRNTSAAIFGHFRGVPRLDGERGGNIRIYLNEPGWMWQIPLIDGVTSLGMVAPGAVMAERKGSIEDFFMERSSRNPAFARLLDNAEPLGPLRATGNFSYRAESAFGSGHVKVGDAFGFIDPIFSTGVHLALTSAQQATDAILASQNDPGRRRRLLELYDTNTKRRLDFVSWFIYAIHDPTFREMLLNPRDILGVERAVISLLAGDFRSDIRLRSRIWLFKMLRWLLSKRRVAEGPVHA